jgi:hypothetical protein
MCKSLFGVQNPKFFRNFFVIFFCTLLGGCFIKKNNFFNPSRFTVKTDQNDQMSSQVSKISVKA